jgi:hypothetical protein
VKAFVIFHNGRKICTAGVGRNGVLSAIVNWIGNGTTDDEFDMRIGGLDSTTEEFVNWHAPVIHVGDEIIIRPVDVKKIDRPARRRKKKSKQ